MVHEGHLVREALAAAYRTETAASHFGTRLARAYDQWNDASGQVKGSWPGSPHGCRDGRPCRSPGTT